jgi:Zn ribbon nucleic-acid-binding protein
MDFMFEDDVDEVGSDVEAYCPKCKADTTHVVISKYEDEIRRVQCNPCGDVHSFRKPRGETEDDVPEPVAAKKRALLKKPGWEDFFARRKPEDAKPYEFREAYRENVMVNHPKFGVGFVSEVVSDSKVEITFRDARRILVHNRRDIPGMPLAAEGDGMPTPAPGKSKGKGAAKPAAEPPAAKGKAADKTDKTKPAAVVAEVVKPGKAPTPLKALPNGRSTAKVDLKADRAAEKASEKASEKAPVKPAAKPPAKAAAKPVAKPAKAAPRAAAKSAAKSAAKKPAPKPPAKKKAAGKKR